MKENQGAAMRSEIVTLEEGELEFGVVPEPITRSARAAGRPILDEPLSAMEKALLAYFRKNAGRTLSREELAEQVWQQRHFYQSRTIDQTVSKLRKKMRARDGRILSVWAFGYRFENHREHSASHRPVSRGDAMARFRTAQKFSVAL